MISNHILQSTLESIKSVSNYELSILSAEGELLLTTMPKEVPVSKEQIKDFTLMAADNCNIGNFLYFKIFEINKLEYILMMKDNGADSFLVGKLAVLQIQSLLTAYKERFDKDNFIKNLILDNLLLVDIYHRSKRLHIENERRRIVFILEFTPDRHQGSIENLKTKFAVQSADFVTAIDETNIIIVKELSSTDDYDSVYAIGESILKLVGQDAEKKAHIAYGTIVNELKEVSRSYKEANMALNIGKIFFAEKNIVAYNTLGIGRLIYQLPIPLCKMFIKEIFANKSPDQFDNETLTTINAFLENNLNVSETSRKLFIHRNTLVYRLDKLQATTGLNLRVFDDAMTFQIALMVVKYMKYMETLDY